MNLVVTGARGLLGAPTAAFCHQMGAHVLGTDIGSRPAALGYDNYLSADLTYQGQVYDVLDGADAVIHLAAIPTQRMFPSAATFFTNVRMAWNVMEAAARLNIKRVVLASSLQVNHTVLPRTPITYKYLPIDEDHPVSPQDDYGLSKLVGETCANTFAQHWGLSIISFRFPFIATQAVFETLRVSDPHTPIGALFTYIHINDAARACWLAATCPLPPNSHHVLLAAARDSFLDVPAENYARQFFPEAEIRPGLEMYGSMMNCARAEQVIGFVPEISFQR